MPRLLALVLLAATSAVAAAAGASPDVRVVGVVTPGLYAAVEVAGVQAGQASLVGGTGSRTVWPSAGGRIVLPLLVPPDVVSPWQVRLLANGAEEVYNLDVDITPGDGPRPPLNVVMPGIYDGVLSWRPARPAAERAAVVAAAGVAAIGCVYARRSRATAWAWAFAAAGTLVLAGVAVVRPDVALRTFNVAGDGFVDSWTFTKPAGTRGPASVTFAVDGLTLPVAFSARHLTVIDPALRCDERGVPHTLAVTLPSGGVAAVVRRLPEDAADVTAEPSPWARPIRRLYPRP